MGRPDFAHIQGAGGRLQIYVKLDVVGEQAFRLFQLLDIGDIVGVSGHLFRTKTDELTVGSSSFTLLSKSLLPLPEKWHGLADVATALPPALPGSDRESAGAGDFLCGARRFCGSCAHFSTLAAISKWKRR